MKYILLFSLGFLAAFSVGAQKKPAAKTAATSTAQKTGSAKTSESNAGTVQSVYMVSGSPEAFKRLAGDARTQFDAGKLDDSRFALQQMLAELDMIIGKEVLKSLPTSITDKTAVTKQDNVTGATGFFGVVIHREYGQEPNNSSTEESRNIEVEIISNSPLISSINAMLSLPLGLGSNGDTKVVKIAGYKAMLNKTSGSNDEPNYELQLPLGSSLITVKAPGASQEQVAQIAGSLPVQEIAKMLQ